MFAIKKGPNVNYQLPILNDLGLHQPVTSLDLQTNGQYLRTNKDVFMKLCCLRKMQQAIGLKKLSYKPQGLVKIISIPYRRKEPIRSNLRL